MAAVPQPAVDTALGSSKVGLGCKTIISGQLIDQ